MDMKTDKKELNPKHPYMIICEGADCEYFFYHYLDYLAQQDIIEDDAYQAFDYGGNDEINKSLPMLPKQRHYDKMKAILVIRDAEKDAHQAITTLQSLFREVFGVEISESGEFVSSKESKIRVGFFLWPGLRSGHFYNGTLEDVCCSLLHDEEGEATVEELSRSADNYLEKLQSFNHGFRRIHKNRLHTILDGTNKFVGMKIGEAAGAGAFNFSSAYLADLKKRIVEMSY